jgi:hypothetical protein
MSARGLRVGRQIEVHTVFEKLVMESRDDWSLQVGG